jgi:putative FmdB family regulatory protein
MPTYVYACRACRTEREVPHPIDAPPPTECPACGGTLERVFTAPGLNLGNYASPAAARYAKMSPGEELADAQAAFESLRHSRRDSSAPPEGGS